MTRFSARVARLPLRVRLVAGFSAAMLFVLAAAAALRAEGAELVRCVCIFTWGWQATAAAFAEATLPLVSLTTLPELLDVAAADGTLSATQRALVEAWVRDPQGWGANIT